MENQFFSKVEWADTVVVQSCAFGRHFLKKERSETVSLLEVGQEEKMHWLS